MRPSPSYFFIQWLSARFFMAKAYSLSVCSSSQCSRQILSKSPTLGGKLGEMAVESTLKDHVLVLIFMVLFQLKSGAVSLNHISQTITACSIEKSSRVRSHDCKKTSDFSEKHNSSKLQRKYTSMTTFIMPDLQDHTLLIIQS